VSATNVQSALSTTDWHLDLAYDGPSRLSVADPSIDDPVNDTGSALGMVICSFQMSLLVWLG